MRPGHPKFYDISVSLGGEAIDFPGDTPYQRKMVQTLDGGGECNLSEITMTVHAGTHMDAPYHFFSQGKTIDRFPVEKFVLSAMVVNIRNSVSIEPEALEGVNIQRGEAVLFKTCNSLKWWSGNGLFDENFVYLSENGADWCLEKEVGLVGIDYVSIEKYGSEGAPAHRKLLGGGIPILEGINLEGVPAGRYALYAFPIKIRGGDGAPVRAVLVV
jgi:arylformamidase